MTDDPRKSLFIWLLPRLHSFRSHRSQITRHSLKTRNTTSKNRKTYTFIRFSSNQSTYLYLIQPGLNLCHRYCPVRSTDTYYGGGTSYEQFLLSQWQYVVQLSVDFVKMSKRFQTATHQICFPSSKCTKIRFRPGPRMLPGSLQCHRTV